MGAVLRLRLSELPPCSTKDRARRGRKSRLCAWSHFGCRSRSAVHFRGRLSFRDHFCYRCYFGRRAPIPLASSRCWGPKPTRVLRCYSRCYGFHFIPMRLRHKVRRFSERRDPVACHAPSFNRPGGWLSPTDSTPWPLHGVHRRGKRSLALEVPRAV